MAHTDASSSAGYYALRPVPGVYLEMDKLELGTLIYDVEHWKDATEEKRLDLNSRSHQFFSVKWEEMVETGDLAPCVIPKEMERCSVLGVAIVPEEVRGAVVVNFYCEKNIVLKVFDQGSPEPFSPKPSITPQSEATKTTNPTQSRGGSTKGKKYVATMVKRYCEACQEEHDFDSRIPEGHIFLYARRRAANDCYITIDTEFGDMKYINEGAAKVQDFTWGPKYYIEQYPYRQGGTLRFIDCGTIGYPKKEEKEEEENDQGKKEGKKTKAKAKGRTKEEAGKTGGTAGEPVKRERAAWDKSEDVEFLVALKIADKRQPGYPMADGAQAKHNKATWEEFCLEIETRADEGAYAVLEEKSKPDADTKSHRERK